MNVILYGITIHVELMNVEMPINNREMMLNIGLEAGRGAASAIAPYSFKREHRYHSASIGFQPLQYNFAGNPMLGYQKKPTLCNRVA